MWVVRRRGTRRVDLRSRGMRPVGRGEGAVGGSARRAAVGGRWVSCGLLGGTGIGKREKKGRWPTGSFNPYRDVYGAVEEHAEGIVADPHLALRVGGVEAALDEPAEALEQHQAADQVDLGCGHGGCFGRRRCSGPRTCCETIGDARGAGGAGQLREELKRWATCSELVEPEDGAEDGEDVEVREVAVRHAVGGEVVEELDEAI